MEPLQGRWASHKPKELHLKKSEGMPEVSEMNLTCNGLNNCRQPWLRRDLCLHHGGTHNNRAVVRGMCPGLT